MCTGKNPGGAEREKNQNGNVMLKLADRYKNSGRTIIADDFFTTLEAAKQLANIGIRLVGRVRDSRTFLPKEFRKSQSRPVLSSHFGFHENLVSLCSYVPRKNKAINLISTVHRTKIMCG